MSYTVPQLKTINIDRYVLPLREGGSVPGLIEADDGQQYVIKFRGAAQGPRVLVAELIGGEIARALGLDIPELAFAHLDAAFGRTENDTELQSQFKASEGLNIGLGYLSGSNTFDPTVTHVSPTLASRIVWLDCLITNIDRTARNTNMLLRNKKLWLIDHGAALYFHYNWSKPAKELALQPFAHIKNHVLLPNAYRLKEVNNLCRAALTNDIIHDIVAQIPTDWLIVEPPFTSPEEYRLGYEQFLLTRIENSDIFVKEALHERKKVI